MHEQAQIDVTKAMLRGVKRGCGVHELLRSLIPDDFTASKKARQAHCNWCLMFTFLQFNSLRSWRPVQPRGTSWTTALRLLKKPKTWNRDHPSCLF